MKIKVLPVYLKIKEHRWLKKESKRTGLSMSLIVRSMVWDKMNKQIKKGK